jgi:hypothetical protein
MRNETQLVKDKQGLGVGNFKNSYRDAPLISSYSM